jgi:hypothetical protein
VCDPKLQEIFNALCSIRQATPGAITLLLRGFLSADQALAKAHRIEHRKNQEKVNMEITKGRAKKVNAAQEVTLHRAMPVIVRSLESFGEARGNAGKKLAYLKQQFTGRIGIGHKCDNKNNIGMQYRSLSKPYQLVMKKKPRKDEQRAAPEWPRLPLTWESRATNEHTTLPQSPFSFPLYNRALGKATRARIPPWPSFCYGVRCGPPSIALVLGFL